MRTKEQWEEIYKNGVTPWDAGTPEPLVIRFIEEQNIQPCSMIDLGCGAGNEAIALAKRGFRVTGVDISERAIIEAQKRAKDASVSCLFLTGNILDMSMQQTYDFVLDRACFHFIDSEERPRYVETVKRFLRPGGLFILFTSSEHDPAKGPYQFTEQEIRNLFSTHFNIESITLVTLEQHGARPRPYMCVLRKKLL